VSRHELRDLRRQRAPQIVGSVLIDAQTQAGWTANPIVVVDGTALTDTSPGSTSRRLPARRSAGW
jgi:hypothetical protein